MLSLQDIRDGQFLLLDELLAVAIVDGSQAREGLTQREHDAFAQMRERLDNGQRQLTTLQHEWAKAKHQELGLGDPAKRNANVPRGRDVGVPEVLRHLPKKPPTRRATR